MRAAMERHEVQILIEDLHREFQSHHHGELATYIPELGKANPDHFGICLATADGRIFEIGDCDQPCHDSVHFEALYIRHGS
jgi:glutaminase